MPIVAIFNRHSFKYNVLGCSDSYGGVVGRGWGLGLEAKFWEVDRGALRSGKESEENEAAGRERGVGLLPFHN